MTPLDLLASITQAAELLAAHEPDEDLERVLLRLEDIEDRIWFTAEELGIHRPYTEES